MIHVQTRNLWIEVCWKGEKRRVTKNYLIHEEQEQFETVFILFIYFRKVHTNCKRLTLKIYCLLPLHI